MDSDEPTALSRRQLLAATSLTTISPLMANTTMTKKPVQITQVRNATLVVEYANTKFLIDPLFAAQGAFPGFAGSASSQLANPLVPLPIAQEQLMAVDAVIVTHLHEDHWDAAASAALPKDMPLFAQNEEDADKIRNEGFTDVRVLTQQSQFNGIGLCKTGGQHGTDATLDVIPLGEVCGVVFSHPQYATLYIAGDTIWNDHVQTAIDSHQPDAIVLNIGNAVFMGYDPIIMGLEDAVAVHRAAPNAILIASHMEAINHCILSRQTLYDYAKANGFDTRLLIPADGETVSV